MARRQPCAITTETSRLVLTVAGLSRYIAARMLAQESATMRLKERSSCSAASSIFKDDCIHSLREQSKRRGHTDTFHGTRIVILHLQATSMDRHCRKKPILSQSKLRIFRREERLGLVIAVAVRWSMESTVSHAVRLCQCALTTKMSEFLSKAIFVLDAQAKIWFTHFHGGL